MRARASVPTGSPRSLVVRGAPRCRTADLPGGSRPIWHSSGGHRSRGAPSFRSCDGSRMRADAPSHGARAARGARRGRGRGRVRDTTRGAWTPTRSRDVTAARGNVRVNRGRDVRNHDDRRTDRTIVRDRFSPLLFLSFSPFSSSRVFISTVQVSANRRAPSCFLAIASGTDRIGATRRERTDGRTRYSWRREPPRRGRGQGPAVLPRAAIEPAKRAGIGLHPRTAMRV